MSSIMERGNRGRRSAPLRGEMTGLGISGKGSTRLVASIVGSLITIVFFDSPRGVLSNLLSGCYLDSVRFL